MADPAWIEGLDNLERSFPVLTTLILYCLLAVLRIKKKMHGVGVSSGELEEWIEELGRSWFGALSQGKDCSWGEGGSDIWWNLKRWWMVILENEKIVCTSRRKIRQSLWRTSTKSLNSLFKYYKKSWLSSMDIRRCWICNVFVSCNVLVQQALKDSTEVEIVDQRIRKRVDPEKWPIPGPPSCNLSTTDFSQLINCPEFIPGQVYGSHTGKEFL